MTYMSLDVGEMVLVPKGMLVIANDGACWLGTALKPAFPVAENGQRILCFIMDFVGGEEESAGVAVRIFRYINVVISDGRAALACPWLSTMLIETLDRSPALEPVRLNIHGDAR